MPPLLEPANTLQAITSQEAGPFPKLAAHAEIYHNYAAGSSRIASFPAVGTAPTSPRLAKRWDAAVPVICFRGALRVPPGSQRPPLPPYSAVLIRRGATVETPALQM